MALSPLPNSSTFGSEGDLYKSHCSGCGGSGTLLTTVTQRSLFEEQDTSCLTCELLRRILITYAAGRPEHEKVAIVRGVGVSEIVCGEGDEVLKISVYGHRDPKSPWNFAHKYKGIKDVPAGRLPNIVGDTASPLVADKIWGWIEKCYSSHEDCKLAARSELPRRVLDVTKRADSNSVYLYESHGDVEQYICLSHSWGGHQPLKTEKSSLAARKEGIEWKDLPRTFQDAVTITRLLGIRYLWIDSLCIVQDDKEDWRRESAKMHNVYQAGYLTIAASSGVGPDSGLFREAPPEYHLRDWNVKGEYIRTRRRIGHLDSSNDYPLMRRGWVFQERIVSRRVLHFSSVEVAWECMEDQDCECGSFRSCIGVEYDLTSPKERYRPIDRMDGWLMMVWRKIVSEYSGTQLTYDKDIFPALSGVAELHRTVRNSTYLAGLWRDTLFYDLLWHIPNQWELPVRELRYQRLARPAEWRAPSWSWASVRSAVTYEDFSAFEKAVHIESVEVKLTGESETGQIEFAWLKASGKLAEVTVHRPQSDDERQRHRTAYLKSTDQVINFEEDYDIWGDCEFRMEEGETLYCLVMGIMFKPESDKNGSDKWWMMVLREMGAVAYYSYTRVGMATLAISRERPDDYGDFLGSAVQTDTIRIV
jgi:hypothetical protein